MPTTPRSRFSLPLPLWTPIVRAFVVLISVWVVFIKIALENQPESVPLESAAGAAGP
ncbi:hypothetical protein BH23VER1_BH23VER1_03220 [soil metagenome]